MGFHRAYTLLYLAAHIYQVGDVLIVNRVISAAASGLLHQVIERAGDGYIK